MNWIVKRKICTEYIQELAEIGQRNIGVSSDLAYYLKYYLGLDCVVKAGTRDKGKTLTYLILSINEPDDMFNTCIPLNNFISKGNVDVFLYLLKKLLIKHI